MLVYIMGKLFVFISSASGVLFSGLDATIMYFYFSMTLGRRKSGLKVYGVTVLIATLALAVFGMYNSFSSPNMMLRTLIAFLSGVILFNGNLAKKSVYITLYAIITIFVELLLFYLAQLAFGAQNTINLVLVPSSIDRIIFKCLATVITVFILYFVAKKHRFDVSIPFRYLAFILGIYGLSTVALLFLFEICLHIDPEYSKVTLAGVSATSISIMLSDVFVFIVFELLCKYFTDKQTATLVEHQQNLTEKYILENEKNYKEIRKLWHDLSNHLGIIQAYLNEKQSTKAAAYIEEVQAKFQDVPMVIKTGNDIADIVINQKRAVAIEKGINFEIMAHVADGLNIAASDVCILLSNALDNAIEASEVVAEAQRKNIQLTIKSHKQFLLIEVENDADHEPTYHRGKLLTRKQDPRNHGLGVLSMESIVKKYGGTIEHTYNNHRFRLTMILNV